MKPISLICILRVSKSQLIENGYKDSIVETIYQLILQYAANESYKLYFPDMCIPCIIQVCKKDKKNWKNIIFVTNIREIIKLMYSLFSS